MSDLALRLTMAVLGQVFLFVLFAALEHQRRRIGSAALAMTFCATLFFGCVATAAGLRLPLPGGEYADYGRIVIQLPLLTAFLLVYVVRGVLDSQRLLIGAAAAYMLFLYFAVVVKLQCSFLPESEFRAVVFSLLGEVHEAVNFSAVGNLLAFLTVPMFDSLAARGVRSRFLRAVAALTGAQAVAMLPELALNRIGSGAAAVPPAALQAQALATLLLAAMLGGYLRLLVRDIPDQKAGVFDFLFAFFGSYGRIRELEEDVSSWENRYRLVLQHTAEVVIVSDAAGVVTEANIAAGKIFGGSRRKNLVGSELFSLFVPDRPVTAADAAETPVYFTCTVDVPGRETTVLSASVSPVRLKNQLLLVTVARDITGERRLAREKEALAEQLVHAQRMESLGVLAGGIAHDFNNFIHAILGHADVALMMDRGNAEKVDAHLRKIAVIAEKAGKLTGQLLGFARQGKYHVVDIDMRELLDECVALLDPGRIRGVTVRVGGGSGMITRGDQLQMHQVVMNLLINALDAVENNSGGKLITLETGPASRAPLAFAPPPDSGPAAEENYLWFAVSDNGSGMDEATVRKAFEPFFTTKPTGQGTGMGLAMVYGTVTHHKGWIQLQSAPGAGTTFCVFLPKAVSQTKTEK